jgi:signal transduction histidine kinase
MITILREFFEINRALLFFIYGLVFFVLGLAITLQSRQHSRLTLARRLHWLALFGFIHALHEWGDLFIPLQATYLPPPIVSLLKTIQLGLLAFSFTCLFQFAIDLLRPLPDRWVWLRWLPIGVTLLWSLVVMAGLTLFPFSLAEWYLFSNIWARYLIGFPSAALAAYALQHHAAGLIAPFSETRTLRMLYLAALALLGYAVAGGLIVPPASFFPANRLNTSLLEIWWGIPAPVFRSLLGLTLTLAIIYTLEIFDLEIERKLNAIEEIQILATERERIGRDLHDRTLQSIYAVGLMLKSSHEMLQLSQNEQADTTLGQALRALDQAIDEIRQHIAELRAQPDTISLAEGLTQLVRNSALSSIAEVEVRLDLPEDQGLSPAQVGHLLAIAKEALSNVARHAHARHVQFAAQVGRGCLDLAIIDDGLGIPSDYLAGYGLQNMRDRARLLEGELSIYSQPGRGTSLTLSIPWRSYYEENLNSNC